MTRDLDRKRAQGRRWVRGKRQKQRLAGLCVRCRQPAAPGRIQCPAHLRKDVERCRRERAARTAARPPRTCRLCFMPIVGTAKKQYCSDAHSQYALMLRRGKWA